MNTATSALKPHHRELQDDPLLKDMAVGLVRGEFKDPTNAARAVLRAHGHNNDAHEESNVHRLIGKYKKDNWHKVGLEEVIRTEIRLRDKDGQPKPTDANSRRLRATATLNEVIQEYIGYEETVEAIGTCELGMAYLLEDFLWDWYEHISGREAVELLVEAVPIAIHRFYEGMMAKRNNERYEDGIVANYPHTTVTFTVDPSRPLEPQRLKTTRTGTLEAGALKVVYKNPDTPDKRWLDLEIKRCQEHLSKSGYYSNLPIWRWPEAKPEPAADTRFRIVDVVADQDASAASPAL